MAAAWFGGVRRRFPGPPHTALTPISRVDEHPAEGRHGTIASD
jgi:hypothetical protein